MIIGIDGNEANQKVRAGSGVYAYNLLRQIYRQYQISNIKYQIYLKDKPISDLPPTTDYWNYQIIKPSKLWTQFGLPLRLWQEKLTGKIPDVFFTPTHYAPRFCPIPSVITIFDLSFIRFPQLFLKQDLYQLKNWTEYSVRQASKIITISQFSKKEITDHYKINPDKIVVAYPGFDADRFNIKVKSQKSKVKNTIQKLKISGEYILYIGTVQPRKNLARLIEAFDLVNKKYPQLKLVICGMIKEGRGGWMQKEIIKEIRNPKSEIRKNIILTGYVQDNDLPYLIVGAKVFVLPSLYEGFGIPVAEAMACGVPVIVSHTSSLPEVVGDAAILVDPYDFNNIADGIKEACYNKLQGEELIGRGLDQVKKFSWESSAKIILDTLQSVKHDRN